MADDVWAPSAAAARGGVGWGTGALVAVQYLIALAQVVCALGLLALRLLGPDRSAGPGALLEGVTRTAYLSWTLLFVVSAPLWIWWHYSAAAAQIARGTTLHHPPLTHALCWFVPLVQLIVPYQTMRELHVAATGGETRAYDRWWMAWGTAALVYVYTSEPPIRVERLPFVVASMIVLAAGRVYYARLVADIGAAQARP